MLSNLRPFLTDSPEASKSWAFLSEKMPWSMKEPKLSKVQGGGLCVNYITGNERHIFFSPYSFILLHIWALSTADEAGR